MIEDDDYDESDGMKSDGEKMAGNHDPADDGCRDYDDYGGKYAGWEGEGHYSPGNWGHWEGKEATGEDEDEY
jgi:hypothetical protein